MQRLLVVRHVPHETIGTLSPLLAGHFTVASWEAWNKRRPSADPRRYAGLVVMGGPMGVYERDRHPFLKDEIRLIQQFIALNKPVLGICLGAQLIAHALGARVYPNRKKEIGWFPLRLTKESRQDPLFQKLPTSCTVFQWHGDTFDLPRGAALLARSPLCRHQAFRWGDRVWGLQFHVEVDKTMILDWLRQPGADKEMAQAGRGVENKIVQGLPSRLPALARLAKPLLSAWVRQLAPL